MLTQGEGAGTPHVLVIAPGFPPVATPTARRARSLVQALRRDGARVTVLTAAVPGVQRVLGTDPALEAAVDPAVEVVVIDNEHPDGTQEIGDWPRERAQDPAGWREAWEERAAADLDEPGYGHLRAALVARAQDLHAQHAVDVVVAVAAPMTTIAVGSEVSRAAGARLVVDLARVVEGHLRGADPRVVEGLEGADVLWAPDVVTREAVHEVYPEAAERIAIVPDGIDDLVAPGVPRAFEPGRPLRAGCFVESDGWPQFVEFVEGWLHAREVDPLLVGASLAVHGRLRASASGPRAAVAQGREHAICVAPRPSVADLGHVHRDLDLVVVLSRGDLAPGGTTDHLLAGRPVLWCTAEPPAPGHPFTRARHVVPVDDLSAATIADAVSAAVRIDASTIEVPTPSTAWPEAVASVLRPAGKGGSA